MSETAKQSFPVFSIAFLILLVLKLLEVGVMATASWWWVFAPLLIPFGIFVLGLLFFLTIAVLAAIFS